MPTMATSSRRSWLRMDLQLQKGPRSGRVPGHPQLPGEWDLVNNDGRRASEDDRDICRDAEREHGEEQDDRGGDEDCGFREPEPEDRPFEDRGEAGRYRVQHRSQQGDDRGMLQGHRKHHRHRALRHQGEVPG
eukprot:1211512-Heterocapsa_arctica.AAC.1